MDGMHVLSFVVVATRAFVRIVLKHRVRDARVRKRRREEYARRGLHHSLPEHRLFRSIERQTSSTRVAKTQISRNVCPFPVSRDDDFFTFCVASFREEKKIREESIARDIARSRKIDGKMHPTGRYEARCTSQNLRCPFYERSRVSVPLSASLSRVPSQALNHCFFARIFFFFSLLFLSHFCLSRAFERHNFERVVRARSEGEPQKKTAIHGSRDAEVCYSNDHVSGGATSAPHLLRISSSRKCKIFLLASVFVGRPIFAFRARTHFARNRTHATLLSQNNLPKHLKWISTMCETQFFTPCEVHSTSGKVRFETHVQHTSCVYTKISTLCRESF